MTTCSQSLSIGGLTIVEESVPTGPYQCLDFSPLLDRAVRGSDRIIPYVDGVTPYPRRLDVFRAVLPLVLSGEINVTGGKIPSDDQAMALIEHTEAFVAALLPSEADADGTFAATWTRPDSSTKTADVHVLLPLQLGRSGPSWLLATLDLSIPVGGFA